LERQRNVVVERFEVIGSDILEPPENGPHVGAGGDRKAVIDRRVRIFELYRAIAGIFAGLR